MSKPRTHYLKQNLKAEINLTEIEKTQLYIQLLILFLPSEEISFHSIHV